MRFLPRLTVLVSILFLSKLVWSNELNLLIHPRYFWLIYLSIGILALVLLMPRKVKSSERGFVWALPLMVIFVLGSLVNFKPLSSAAQQEISYKNLMSTNQIRSKHATSFKVKTEDLSLGELVAVFSANPEPSKYVGEPVEISGFYFETVDGSPMIARHVLNCCAADARLVGIWLNEPLDLEVDTWINLKGNLDLLEAEDARLISIKMSDFEIIEPPEDPYVVQ